MPELLSTGHLDPGAEAVIGQNSWVLSIAKPFIMDDLNPMFRRIAALG